MRKVTMLKNRKQYEKWIERELKSFSRLLPDKENPAKTLHTAMLFTYHKHHSLCRGNFLVSANLTTGETVIFNSKTMRMAKAKCHSDDNFSIFEGVAIAWAKYNNEDIPAYHKAVSRDELQNGDTIQLDTEKPYCFIGWLPEKCSNEDKRAVVYDSNKELRTVIIHKEVIKLN